MTSEPNTRAGEALKPCPWCNAELTVPTPVQHPKMGLARLHPGSIDDGSCPIAGWGFYAEQLERWNTRAGEALKPFKREDRFYETVWQMIQGLPETGNTRPLPQPSELVEGYDPCPTCRQYSHSIGCDVVAAAFNHFQSMIAHPVRGHPMGDAFDEQTRDAAQVLMAQLAKLQADGDKLAGALRNVLPFVLTGYRECRGDKCRMPNCASCYGEDEARIEADNSEIIAASARQALTEWKDRA